MTFLYIFEQKLTVRHFRLQCEGESNAVKLQMTANAIALMARSLSFDSEFMSPFSVSARRNNINATGESISYTLCSALCISISIHTFEWMSPSHTDTRHWLRFSSLIVCFSVNQQLLDKNSANSDGSILKSLMRILFLNWFLTSFGIFSCR